MAYGYPFFSFVHNRQTGQFAYREDNTELFLTVDEVTFLIEGGHVTDGIKGGLGIGKFHYEDGCIYRIHAETNLNMGEKLKDTNI